MNFLILVLSFIGVYGTYDDWTNCRVTNCSDEIATCSSDSIMGGCAEKALITNLVFFADGDTTVQDNMTFTEAVWWGLQTCSEPAVFDCNGGFTEWYDCAVYKQNCYDLTLGPCDIALIACLNDATCGPMYYMNFLQDFGTGSQGQALDLDTYIALTCWWPEDPAVATGCGLFRDWLSCTYADAGCPDLNLTSCTGDFCDTWDAQLRCKFDFNCGYVHAYFFSDDESGIVAEFPDFMTFEDLCEYRLCLYDTFELDSDLICNGAFGPYGGCTADWYTIFTFWQSCIPPYVPGEDCVFDHCATEINLCNNDFWENWEANGSFVPGDCSQDLYEVAMIEDTYGIKADWLNQKIKDWYCQFDTAGGICQTDLEDAYDCYAANCADFDTTECYQLQCETDIVNCFNDASCGWAMLYYLENKQWCFDNIEETSNYTCRCKQDGDNDTYWDDNMYSYNCMYACQNCEDNAFDMLGEYCRTDGVSCGDSGTTASDVFGCVFEECGTDDDPTDDCDLTGCGREIADCYLDKECYNAMYNHFDSIVWILIATGDLLIDGIFSIQDAVAFGEALSKYHCDPDYNTYYEDTGYEVVCNNFFWDLWDCIANECWFNDCIWQSCGEELNTCLHPDDDDPTCYNNLAWLSEAYDDHNGTRTVYLWYAGSVDYELCGSIDPKMGETYPAQCYYNDIVGYCLTWGCNLDFYAVVDCFLMNCDEDGDFADISYDLSGTTNTPCAIIQTAIIIASESDEKFNLCDNDWTFILYCAFDLIGEDNRTDIATVDNYFLDTLGTACATDHEIDGRLFLFVNCNDESVDNTPGKYGDILTIYINVRFIEADAFIYAYEHWDETGIAEILYAIHYLGIVSCDFDSLIFGDAHVGYGTDCWKYLTAAPTSAPTEMETTAAAETTMEEEKTTDPVNNGSGAYQVTIFIAAIFGAIAALF